MADIASLEDDVKQYQEQLDVVNAGLKDDPGNPELLALKSELDDALGLLNESLAELKPTKTAPPPPKEPSPPPAKEKWSRENHPALKKAPAAAPPPPPADDRDAELVTYQVNDTVMAKWVSGDKSFYPARITSITGSKTDPIYIVKFKSYDNTDQLRGRDMRPMTQKRKADDSPATPSFSAPTSHQAFAAASSSTAGGAGGSNSGVISAAANIDLELAQKQREAAQNAAGGEAKPKTKKLRATKELEKGKNKWQEFNSKSKFAKTSKGKKDSMFRTPDGVHGRVGFTGSGQAMRKDPTRSRHIYQANEEVD